MSKPLDRLNNTKDSVHNKTTDLRKNSIKNRKDFEEDLLLKPSKSYRRRGSVYFQTYGCTANKYDLEIMLAILKNGGYGISYSPDSADVILINTCGVKKPTEDKILYQLKSLRRFGKPVVISGCLPKIDMPAIQKAIPDYSAIIDPFSLDKILLAVIEAEHGGKNKIYFSQKPTVKPRLPKVRLNKLVEILQIAEGCTGACSFCCVRFARGKLFSYPKDLILNNVKKAVRGGAKEIWLTAQDTGAYGKDIGIDLTKLLKEICMIDGKFFVRVGMMNPKNALKILPGLIEVYKNSFFFKFLHLPVQSGDDEVLKLMNRDYSVKEFKEIVYSFRKEIPKISISTDVICGFPGETNDAFRRTVQLIEEVQPDIVNISRFFPRPKTPTINAGVRVSSQEVKERSRILTRKVRKTSLEKNRTWMGWEGEVLIDERGRGPNQWMGRNYAYKQVVVKSDRFLFGKTLIIRVVEAFPTFLRAEIRN